MIFWGQPYCTCRTSQNPRSGSLASFLHLFRPQQWPSRGVFDMEITSVSGILHTPFCRSPALVMPCFGVYYALMQDLGMLRVYRNLLSMISDAVVMNLLIKKKIPLILFAAEIITRICLVVLQPIRGEKLWLRSSAGGKIKNRISHTVLKRGIMWDVQ